MAAVDDVLPERESCCCGVPHLTRRQVEVLRYVAMGMSNTSVAARLQLSARTVDHHIAVMLRMCAVRSRTELVGLCYAAGILVPGRWPPEGSGRLCIRVASATDQQAGPAPS